jgi:uncharacterized repeat protein (TIGR02543 family)
MKKEKLSISRSLFIVALLFAACELGGPVPRPSYTIVYHSNGGNGEMDGSTIVYGASRNLNANEFIREGYHFTGWAETPAGEVKYADRQSVNNLTKNDGEVIDLYAQWRGNSYTVTYNANGGAGSMEDSVFTYGVPQNLRDNTFTRTGYTFAGWARTSDGQIEYADGANVTDVTTTGTAVLYAQWQGISYTVAYDANGGQGNMADSAFIYGTAQNLRTNTFTLAGHALTGWAKTPNGAVEFANGESVTNLTATAGDTVTLYAQWALAYEVSFNADGGSPAPAQQMVVIGGKFTEPDAMTKTGYAFDGWYKEVSLTNKWDFASDTVTTNITLYAKWIPMYTVTFNADGGSPAPVQQTAACGGNVTEPDAMSKTGYTFDGWYKEAGFINKWNFASDTVTVDITLYAKWNVNQYTVTFNANGGTPAPTTPITVSHGQKITEPAVMGKAGNVFNGWYKEAAFVNRWNFTSDTVTGNITLYARWIAAGTTNYTVTYNINGGSGTTPSAQTAAAGSSITLPSGSGLTRTGYTFGGWNTNNSGTGTTYSAGSPYTVTGTTTLYARWDVPTFESVTGLANKLAWLQNNAQSGGSYTIEVTTNENISPTTLSYSGKNNITITLRGSGANRTVNFSSNGAMFTVESGVTLVLDNNITLRGRTNNNNVVARVNSGGTLIMNTGSTISGNNNNNGGTWAGGGVYVAGGGTFTMNGGEISGNTASGSGSSGGGVYVTGTNAAFTMNSGKISGNTSTDYYSCGGGVYVVSGGTFTMNGGEISDNTSSGDASRGSGVYVGGGTFTMVDGKISGNTATLNGGGVYVDGTSSSPGTFTMNGGQISGNNASGGSGGGGGVYVNSAIFTMNDGEISGNTATLRGGGMYVSGGPFTKTGGTIYGYSTSDTVNSNVVKNLLGTVQNNRGHAVYTESKLKETTAGPGVNLSYEYNNGSPIFDGVWDN